MRVVELATWQTTATTMLSEALLDKTTTPTASITGRAAFNKARPLTWPRALA